MTHAEDIDRQARWELRAIREGVARYRRSLLHRDDQSSLPAPQRVLRACATPLSAALLERQEEATSGMLMKGRQPLWYEPVVLFKADALAVTTIMAAFSCAIRGEGQVDDAGTLVTHSRALCRRLQDQLRFDVWVSHQTVAEDTGVEPHEHLLAQMRRRYGDTLTWKQWNGWARRVKAARVEPWDIQTSIAFGAMLFHKLVESCPGWFAIKTCERFRKPPAVALVMLPAGLEEIREADARAELAAPTMMPMLMAPNPWRYAECPTRVASSSTSCPSSGTPAAISTQQPSRGPSANSTWTL